MKEFFKLSITLCLIAFISALVLAVVNNITDPIIKENSSVREENAKKEVLPSADSFTEIEEGIFKADNGAGYCVAAEGEGYGGTIKMIVGVSNEGKVSGIKITEISETPGLGMNANTDEFQSQFKNKPFGLSVTKTESKSENEVVAISGATRTTNAVVNTVNAVTDMLIEKGLTEGGVN